MEVEKLQIVTFEQAKALKEVGFDFRDIGYWSVLVGKPDWRTGETKEDVGKPKLDHYKFLGYAHYNNNYQMYAAPTVALALKWLRDEKQIHCCPEPYVESYGNTNITGYFMGEIRHEQGGIILHEGDDNYPSHDEAESAALDVALKLLKDDKD